MRKRPSALNYSLKLLSYRGRSERELINRLLMKGYPDDEIKGTLEQLKDMGLIDDRKLALDFINYAKETKKLGSIGTRNFLLSRGIPEDIIRDFSDDITDEEENALRLIEKRNFRVGEKRKVYSLLQRKGYSFETIRKVLRKFYNEEVS